VILSIAVFLVVGIVLPEVFLRLFFDEVEVTGKYWDRGAFEGSETLGYRHARGYSGRAFRRDAFDIRVEISEQGLRQRNTEEQAAYPRRLLLLGDSYTFGLGVSEEESFAGLLQEPLNRLGLGVINAGQSGYGVEQGVRLGISLTGMFDPQVILLSIFLGNDFENDYYRTNYENVEVKYGFRVARDRWPRGAFFDYLRTHSYLWLLVRRIIGRAEFRVRYGEFMQLAKDDPGAASEHTIEAVRQLARHCRERDIVLGVMVIPGKKDWGKALYRRLLDALEEEHIPCLDLSVVPFDDSDRFKSDEHWNENGHQKALERLIPFCRELAKGL